MKLVFATHNRNKFEEVQSLLPGHIHLLSLSNIGCNEEIAETADTIEGNAMLKANYVWENYHYACFADDTGLEVELLNGEPGVLSARYAGEAHNAEANIDKLLKNLAGKKNRNALFKTMISLKSENENKLFNGICKGEISTERKGKSGFGYDPIFIPNGFVKSFAEMSLQEKNLISHRGKAMRKLVAYLSK